MHVDYLSDSSQPKLEKITIGTYGTTTTVNLTSYTGYSKWTNDNFYCEVAASGKSAGGTPIYLNNYANIAASQSKAVLSYDPTTGVLSVTPPSISARYYNSAASFGTGIGRASTTVYLVYAK